MNMQTSNGVSEEKNKENEEKIEDEISEISKDEKTLDDEKSFEDKYKRALADYQNLLKQTAKEKMEFAIYANEQMLREILPVYDHLKMAIAHYNGESTDDWITGVKHVVKQFKDVLEKIGVEEIKVKDKKFDHNLMDALSNEETEDEKLDGLVAKEIKAGYKLNGKIIEPVKVIVYKKK
jgi:molecular chaperone GrpE